MHGIGVSSRVSSSIICGLLLYVSAPAHASLVEVPVFGPEVFLRDAESPQSVVRDFAVTKAAQVYVMEVGNGSVNQTNLVSGAVIKVNGNTILKQSDFNQRTYSLQSLVSLDLDNQLDVKVNSIPSSYVTVTVYGYYHPEDVDDDGDGFTENEGDCDDLNAAVHPEAEEICDGADNDCDETVDEKVATTYFHDADGDGYGDFTHTVDACTAPEGYVAIAHDCDDTKAAVNPGASEVCGNDTDDNCADGADEGCASIDEDGDGIANHIEMRFGTDPSDAADIPRATVEYRYGGRGDLVGSTTTVGRP